MDTPPESGPEQPGDAARDDEQAAPTTPAAPTIPVTDIQLLPASVPVTSVPVTSVSVTSASVTQSREDTDAGWGEYGDRADDERLLRDRPPHWGNG